LLCWCQREELSHFQNQISNQRILHPQSRNSRSWR
jgi:hypothetical protein